MGFARLCRCGPFGTHGIDLVPAALPEGAVWYRPWSYGRWRGVEAPPLPPHSLLACEEVAEPAPAAPGSLRALLTGDRSTGSTPRQET